MTRRDAHMVAEELIKLNWHAEPYIDRKAAAEYLCMTIAALDQHKDIPKYHIGKSVRFKRSELDKWVMSQN